MAFSLLTPYVYRSFWSLKCFVVKLTQRHSVFFTAYVVIVLLQWMHFTLYFNQPIGISLLWSIVDWFVWFSLLALLWRGYAYKSPVVLCTAFIVLAGPIQIVCSSAIYQILYSTDKSLIESFFNLMNKRWLQNLMIAALFSLCVSYLHHLIAQRSVKVASNSQSAEKLTLSDGTTTYYVNEEDILAVVSSKNYLSVFTENQEIVVRDTLKNMHARLDDKSFVQVSRSALVNLSAIKHVERYSRNSYRAVLSNQSEINIGRTFYRTVQDYLHMSQQQLHSSQ